MNAKPTLTRPGFLPCVIAALSSAVISAGLLGAVGSLFLSNGIPFGKIVAAERICRDHAFVSEREECVRRVLASPIHATIASAPCGSAFGEDAALEVAAETPAQHTGEGKRVELTGFSALQCRSSLEVSLNAARGTQTSLMS